MAFNESNPTGRENPAGKAADDVKQAKQQARQQAAQKVDQNRERAADELDKIAHAARAAASDLEEQQDGLSNYVAEMANGIGSLANSLREKNMDDLIQDAKRIARNNPALFLAGSVAIGFGLSRFAKASGHRSEEDVSIRRSEFDASIESSYPPVGGSTSARADTQYGPGIEG
ncbi:MAG TPA: hypothetical protein VF268_13275 [Gammaproteobacteria bacterium]